eukprot:342622_1
MFPNERITRRRRKKKRANTLDPTQDLHRFSTTPSPSTPTEAKLKRKSGKNRMAKSKSPSGYKPRLEDKIKRKNKKRKGRRRANSDIHGDPITLKVDIKDPIDIDTKPKRPMSTTIRKKKKKKKYQSQTPVNDYVGLMMDDDDPFNVRKPKRKTKSKAKKQSMTPIVSLTSTIDDSVYSSRSDEEDAVDARERSRSQSARFSALKSSSSKICKVKLTNSRTITETTRVLQTVNAGIKKDINRGFHEFRRGLEDQQMQLMDDLESLYADKKEQMTHIEQKLFQNGKKSKNVKGEEFEFDPNITLVLNSSEIMQQIKTYGYIEGVKKNSNHVASSSVIIHSDDDDDDMKEDDQVITMAMKQKEILGQIQNKTMEKLDMVILMEKEAKKKAKQAALLTKEVDEGLAAIHERTEIINQKIEAARPELDKARHAVDTIDPKDINEIKTLKAPPVVIENVITATVMILGLYLMYCCCVCTWCVVCIAGHNIKTWRDVQKLLSYKFKPQLLNFDTYSLSKDTRKKVYKKYAGKEDFNYDRVYEASKVCGNLVLWVLSQIKYSRMLDIIIPLEKEVKKLKRESNKKKKMAKALLKIVNELEGNIKLYTAQCNEMIDHIIKSTDHELKQFSDKLQPLNEKFNALLNNKVLD